MDIDAYMLIWVGVPAAHADKMRLVRHFQHACSLSTTVAKRGTWLEVSVQLELHMGSPDTKLDLWMLPVSAMVEHHIAADDKGVLQ